MLKKTDSFVSSHRSPWWQQNPWNPQGTNWREELESTLGLLSKLLADSRRKTEFNQKRFYWWRYISFRLNFGPQMLIKPSQSSEVVFCIKSGQRPWTRIHLGERDSKMINQKLARSPTVPSWVRGLASVWTGWLFILGQSPECLWSLGRIQVCKEIRLCRLAHAGWALSNCFLLYVYHGTCARGSFTADMKMSNLEAQGFMTAS